MKKASQIPDKIRVEMANGESFARRVNRIVKYNAGLVGVDPQTKAQYVRAAIARVLDLAEVIVETNPDAGELFTLPKFGRDYIR